MSNTAFILLLSLLVGTATLSGQCPTVAEINQRFYPDRLEVDPYLDSLAARCPAYRDSLQPALYSLSILAYAEGRDLGTAVYFGEWALDLKRELLAGEPPTVPLGKCLHNLGIFTHQLGRYREAEAYLKEAIEVYQTIGHAERKMRSLSELGYVYGRMGDYPRSSEWLGVLIRESRREGAKRHTANGLRLLGQNLVQQKEYRAALDTLTRALGLYEALEDWMNIARTNLDLAGAAYGHRDFPSVERYAAVALSIFTEASVDREVAKLHSLLALSRSAAGDETGARLAWNRNLDYVTGTGDPVLLAQAYDNGAELAVAAGDYDLAIERVARAIGALVGEWTPTMESPVPSREDLRDNPHQVDLFIYLGDLARIYHLADRNQDAMAAIFAADGVLDVLADEQAGTVGKLFWRERALPVYERGIAICREENAEGDAFFFFEKSRALLLLEAWEETDLRQRLPESLSSAMDSTNRSLRQLQRALLVAGETESDSLRERVRTTREVIQRQRDRAERLVPAYATRRVAPKIIDEAATRTTLATGHWDRQLQYFLGDDRLYLLELSPGKTTLHDLGDSEVIEESVRELLFYYTGPEKIDQDPEGFLAHSHRVYQSLLGPVRLAAGEQLLVLPDGLLAFLPFGALVMEPGQQDLANAAYLIREHPVSYAQSATLLRRQQTAPASSPKVLAFAPFVVAGNEEVSALPFSGEEIAGLKRNLEAVVLVNGAATREELLARMASTGILHVSSHAFANPAGSMPPQILTATDPIFLPDVYGVRLTSNLVTLSACQSNIGPLARGEGVMGMGRAFAAAGARGVVASLWMLNDRAVAEINEDFYAALSQGSPKPIALHEAQMSYLESTDKPAYLKSPYYWAGLTYYGDARPVERPASRWPWFVAVGLLFGAGLFWIRRKAKA